MTVGGCRHDAVLTHARQSLQTHLPKRIAKQTKMIKRMACSYRDDVQVSDKVCAAFPGSPWAILFFLPNKPPVIIVMGRGTAQVAGSNLVFVVRPCGGRGCFGRTVRPFLHYAALS